MGTLPTLHPALIINRDNPRREAKISLGHKVSHDMMHNCLTCLKWSVCKDSQKSVQYRCSKFREATIEATDISTLMKGEDWSTQSQNSEEEIQQLLQKDDEESITQMIERVLNSNVPVPPDLRINDRHIPSAKNLYQWTTDKLFSGGLQTPFPRQVEVGTKLYAEYCPRCSDVEWFDQMPVDAPLSEMEDRVVFLEHGVCPQCHVKRGTLIAKKELFDYFSLILLAGQRSSKTSSAILWESYNTHHALLLPNPSTVYGLLPSQPIYSSYTALTFGQAVENIWAFFKKILEGYPWYVNYHRFLDQIGHELGEELYHVSEMFARYRHRNIYISPSSPSKRVMRGRTRLSALVDELGWFPLARKGDKKGGADFERLDAKGVRDALVNSMFTLRQAYQLRTREGYNVPKPMFMTASSPQAYNDAIMTMYRENITSKFTLALKYPTWDYNPKVTREDFEPDYEKDPVAAARDFGCEPPIGEGLFITDMEATSKCFQKKQPNAISINTFKGLSKTKKKITTANMKFVSDIESEFPTILAVDVGLVHNSFAFSVIGLPNDYDEDVTSDERGTPWNPIQVYAVGEVIPRDDAPISLTHIHNNCLIPLVEHFNCAYFVSDRWQNAKIASDLENEYEVVPIEHKCKWTDFECMRDLLYSGNLILPRLDTPFMDLLETTLDDYPDKFRKSPTDHLFYQMATVQESTGVTVLKGNGTTDDIFRTIVLGATLLQDEEVFQYLLDNRVGITQLAEPPRAITVRASGGGSRGGGNSGAANGSATIVKYR